MRRLLSALVVLGLWVSSPMAREIIAEGFAPSGFIRIPETGQFRVYYNTRSGANFQMKMITSPDGSDWSASPITVRNQVEANGASWGTTIVDRGPGLSDPTRRFKNVHYWIGPGTNGAYV